MDWRLFLAISLWNKEIFIEYQAKIDQNIFKNTVLSNIFILIRKFTTKYKRIPDLDSLVLLLDRLPEEEKANHLPQYKTVLKEISDTKVSSIDMEAFRDNLQHAIINYEMEKFILKTADDVGKIDFDDVREHLREVMAKCEFKKAGEEMDTSFFLDVGQAIQRQKRDLAKVDPDKMPKYSIKCLNDFLFGLFPCELVVIGADTGIGKTQMASDIARVNAMAGRKVYLISLEGAKNEIISRYKYEIIAREYFQDPTGMPMSYPLYNANMLEGIQKFESIAERELMQMEKCLKIYGKSETIFTIETLIQQMGRITDADLVVIDHLHYFSMMDDTTEAQQLSDIMRKVKDLTQLHNIPVVLVSHLRRKSKDRKVPDNDDFYGSSNIAKIADTTILLSTLHSKEADNTCPTVVSLGKSRNGHRTDIGFLVNFDTRIRTYEDNYELMKINPWKDPVVLDPAQYPSGVADLMGKKNDPT